MLETTLKDNVLDILSIVSLEDENVCVISKEKELQQIVSLFKKTGGNVTFVEVNQSSTQEEIFGTWQINDRGVFWLLPDYLEEAAMDSEKTLIVYRIKPDTNKKMVEAIAYMSATHSYFNFKLPNHMKFIIYVEPEERQLKEIFVRDFFLASRMLFV